MKAKLFMNGRSQAVRLPAKYRFDTDEVYIHRNEETGEIILSPKPSSWDDFFALVENSVPEDFMADRVNEKLQDRGIFE